MMKTKLQHLKIKGYKELINGFLIKTGIVWELYDHNPADFLLDGMILIQKKFLLNNKQGRNEDYDNLNERIYNLKKTKEANFLDSINLDSTQGLFDTLKTKPKLIGVQIKKENSLFIGKIVEVRESSIYLKLLSVKGKWLEKENFKYNEIRTVSLDSDYMNSLELLLKTDNMW